MNVNVEVTRNNNESSTGTLRRFTRRVQEAGILSRVRSIRYAERNISPFTAKKRRLKSISRREAMEKLAKLGKLNG